MILAVTVGVLGLHAWKRARGTPATGVGLAQSTQTTAGPEMRPRYTETATAAARRRSMVDELRALGVPSDILGLVAHVDREVEWEARFEKHVGNRSRVEALQLDMDMSKDVEMRAALGEKDFKAWETKNVLGETMSTAVEVTDVETDAIYDAKKQLERRLLGAHQARLRGMLDESGEAAVSARAYAEFDQQLKAVLGPDRYARSQQRDDAFAAAGLRAVLAKAKVKPSESQFQELFAVEQKFSAARLNLGEQRDECSPTVEFLEQLTALNAARDLESERILGSDAARRLQRARDPSYSQMKKYETYWGLDDRKIDFVCDAMKEYGNAMLAYVMTARAQGHGAEVMEKHLLQLTTQTEETLKNCLGEDSFNKLQRNRVVQFHRAGAAH